jgi:heme oxygenase (biliverdin-IX-beta and delta-forming)
MLRTANLTGVSLRVRLREACAQSHRELDERLGVLDLRLLHDYRTFLEINAAALIPLEAALVSAHVERMFPDWDRRSRSDAILSDFARLGGIARPLSAPEALGSGGILGTMYVLEGSRLGARVLLRRALQSPHIEVLGARAYLDHGVGSDFWQSFNATLEFHGARLSDHRPVVRAARRAFDLFAAAASIIGAPSAAHVNFDGARVDA